jgi:hypothetical protein
MKRHPTSVFAFFGSPKAEILGGFGCSMGQRGRRSRDIICHFKRFVWFEYLVEGRGLIYILFRKGGCNKGRGVGWFTCGILKVTFVVDQITQEMLP